MFRPFADWVVTGSDWTLDDLCLAYLTWVERRVAADEASPDLTTARGPAARHTLEGRREHLNLICKAPRGGATSGLLPARELTTEVVAELVRRRTEGVPAGSKVVG